MEDKDKTTAKKKSYKKPSADKLGDGDLQNVTGGGGGSNEQNIGFCILAGLAAITTCGPGGAAARNCENYGGAANIKCDEGFEAKRH